MNERQIPPAAVRDPDSFELVRVWVAENGLHASLQIGTYQETPIAEERAWGIILSDIARHVASALAEGSASSEHEILQSITTSFFDEIDQPTSKVEGGFVDDVIERKH